MISLILSPVYSMILSAAPAVISYSDYQNRARISEGLILASSAKNLVIDNAVNGFELDDGWDYANTSPFTDNIKSIEIDGKTGVILITGTEKIKGLRLVLTPYTGYDSQATALAVGVVPEGRVIWRCRYLPYSSGEIPAMKLIPAECREIEN